MRAVLIMAVALSAAVGVATASAASKPPDPCVLVTVADATPVFGATPARSRTVIGTIRSCTYTVKRESMTVETRALPSRAAFIAATRAIRGLVVPIETIANAFSAENGREMLLWKNGVEVTVRFAGLDPVFATQTTVANAALNGI